MTWMSVCQLAQVPAERGVAALVDGEQVALFRVGTSLYAVGNCDPFSSAMVISRGIVGSRGDRPTVASPMFKQVFDLETGICLDDTAVALPVHAVRVVGDQVQVALADQVRQPA